MRSWILSINSYTSKGRIKMKVFCLLALLGAAAAHETGKPHQHPGPKQENIREARQSIFGAPHHALPAHPVHHAALHAAPVHHGAPLHHRAPVHHAAPVTHAALHAAPLHHPAPVHPPVPVHPAPAPYAPPHPAPHHPAPYHEPVPKNYEFGYGVHEVDEYGNPNVHSRHEVRDGPTVKGQYTVELPDCRKQIVDYYVDEYHQYHADVKYEGEICPDKSLKHPHPAPYHPAPVHPAPAPYHPAPVHPAPVHHAPVHLAPAPYHPAPVHHAAPYAPAPY